MRDSVKRLTSLIPMGRLASQDEYKAAVVFLVSGMPPPILPAPTW